MRGEPGELSSCTTAVLLAQFCVLCDQNLSGRNVEKKGAKREKEEVIVSYHSQCSAVQG